MEQYWLQKKNKVPNTKKYKFFEKHFEFRKKSKNIAGYWQEEAV